MFFSLFELRMIHTHKYPFFAAGFSPPSWLSESPAPDYLRVAACLPPQIRGLPQISHFSSLQHDLLTLFVDIRVKTVPLSRSLRPPTLKRPRRPTISRDFLSRLAQQTMKENSVSVDRDRCPAPCNSIFPLIRNSLQPLPRHPVRRRLTPKLTQPLFRRGPWVGPRVPR